MCSYLKQFSKIYPKGFPPTEAISEKLFVYRLIKGFVPEEDDFKSFVELGRNVKSDKYPFIEYGLSVNTEYADAEKVFLGNIKSKRRYKSIAYRHTYICTGLIQRTPPNKNNESHVTWWIYNGICPANFFKTVIKQEL